MVWQLTRIGLLISLAAAATADNLSAQNSLPSGGRPPVRGDTYSVHWEQLPLGLARARLKAMAGTTVFLDRRVDPNQPIDLSLSNATADEIVARVANACSLGVARLESLLYLGPPQAAERLRGLAAMRRKDVASLADDERRSLSERRRIAWPRLSEPRGLLGRLVEDHGWRLEHGERIPHDVWAAGELPQLTLADQLTILLAGFDSTYRIVPERHTLEIVPVDWDQIKPAPTATAHRRPNRSAPAGKQVFTLRVEEQPVGKVLEQLGQRLGWQLDVDEAAIRAAGRSLDQRVSLEVENVEADELLNALLTPAGLRAERNGKIVRVLSR